MAVCILIVVIFCSVIAVVAQGKGATGITDDGTSGTGEDVLLTTMALSCSRVARKGLLGLLGEALREFMIVCAGTEYARDTAVP